MPSTPAMTARILVAGPNPAAAQALSARLAALGHEVAGVARTTDDAIAASTAAAPDLVLLDAALAAAPGGRRAVEVLRRTVSAPILFLAEEGDLAAVRTAGLTARDGVVVAPVTDRDLRLGVETTLLRRDAASETQELEERFFAISIDMLCFLGFDGYFRRLNPAWERTLGFTVDELRSRPFIEFVHPDDRERTLRQNAEVRAGGRALGFENRYRCKDGSYRWLRWNAAPDQPRQSIYSVARDVTEQKRVEAELEQLSTKDELTGLWNRRGFSVLAAQEIKRVQRRPAPLLLFFIDVDRFKHINDTYGHAEGDRVLAEVGRVLQESCRGSDIVARHGGDEFVILATDATGDGEQLIPKRIGQGVERLNAAHEHPYEIELTIGSVCQMPGEEVELSDLLARADQEMYGERRRKSAAG